MPAKKAVKTAIEALAQERQASVSPGITAAIPAERERLAERPLTVRYASADRPLRQFRPAMLALTKPEQS